MTDKTNPLDESHFQQIEQGLASASRALAQVELAKRAGIDTGDSESRAREAQAKLLRIKQVYFPGR